MKGHDAHPFLRMPCTAHAVSAYQDGVGVLLPVHFWLGVWRCLFLNEWQQVLTPFPLY